MITKEQFKKDMFKGILTKELFDRGLEHSDIHHTKGAIGDNCYIVPCIFVEAEISFCLIFEQDIDKFFEQFEYVREYGKFDNKRVQGTYHLYTEKPTK